MEKKKIYLIALIVIIIAVIAVVAFTFFSGPSEVTPFDTKFMAGEFVGKPVLVTKDSNGSEWTVFYQDNESKIDYSLSSCTNLTYLEYVYTAQGAQGPEKREFNGVQWRIYYAQGVSNDTGANTTYNMYLCVAEKDGQSYAVIVTADASSGIKADASPDCDLFKEFLKPLLSSIEFKHNDDVIEPAEMFGFSQSEYDSTMAQLTQVIKVRG